MLAKHLAEVRAERDEPADAERVLERVSAQLADERAQAAPMPGQVGGRAVMLMPHREPGADESVLLPDYQRITAAVRQAAGPVMVLGESVGWTSACGPSWSVPVGSAAPVFVTAAGLCTGSEFHHHFVSAFPALTVCGSYPWRLLIAHVGQKRSSRGY
ncbi:hypothetical protein [Streptomyces cadmiisoli]|uniref:hypothetical protein n=1 Tax=Streptomyces cadmiisoli TaxID=2184053 RepID=UPI001FE36286|nr:hypothetical protein [Streptomyces cadmiisoli]